jgi:hypothetical protein
VNEQLETPLYQHVTQQIKRIAATVVVQWQEFPPPFPEAGAVRPQFANKIRKSTPDTYF